MDVLVVVVVWNRKLWWNCTAREVKHCIVMSVMMWTVIAVQLVAGKMMEQGPVLVVSFTAQQINVVHDVNGKVVEGDPVCMSCSVEFTNCRCC